MNQNICRICLNTTPLIYTFQGTNIADKIMRCTSVKVEENDGLPQAICQTCQDELDISFEFKLKCEYSDKKLREGFDTEHSVDVIDTTESYTCYKCNMIYQDKHSLTFHIRNVHSKGIVNSNIYKLQIGTEHALVKHKRQKYCSKRKAQETLHQCHICGIIFKYERDLNIHICSHLGMKLFICYQCNNSFTFKSSLSKHLMKHTGIKRFECYLCPKKFVHSSNLQVHLKVHKNEKQFSCYICLKRFKSNRTLSLHFKIHTNERNFPCNQCEKAFINKYDLLRHLKLHDKKRLIEEGSYDTTNDEISKSRSMRQCDQCGKICSGLGDLKKHLRIHSGEKPYQCSHCEKSFKSSSNLRSHERTHLAVRPFTCNFCGHGFTQSSNLRTHERLHSGVKPFQCSLCNTPFNRKRDLGNHAKKHETESKMNGSNKFKTF